MKYNKIKLYENVFTSSINQIETRLTDIELQLKNIKLFLENISEQFKKDIEQEIDREYERIDCLQTLINFNASSVLQDDDVNELGVRFSKYTGYIFPSLFLGYEARFLKHLVAAEPLYIANWGPTSLPNNIEQFNEYYQKKLCLYPLFDKIENLDSLPSGQFSFILCWDVVPFLNLSNTEKLFNILYDLLRPGGTLVFNFNNCDKPAQIELVEQIERAYQLPHKLYLLLKKFIDIKYINFNEQIDYMICNKPGKLSSIKLQASLSEILSK